jgi:hypothetical protein
MNGEQGAPAALPGGFKRNFYMPNANRIILSVAAGLGVINGILNSGLALLIPVWLVIVVIAWTVPTAVVSDLGIRPLMFRSRIPWPDVSQVSTREGRRSRMMRLTLKDGRTVSTSVPVADAALLEYFVYWAHLPPPNPAP